MRDQLHKCIAEYSEFFEPNAHWAGYHNMRRDQSDYEVKAQEACYHVSYLAKSRGRAIGPHILTIMGQADVKMRL